MDKMTKIVCAFFLLLAGISAYPHHLDNAVLFGKSIPVTAPAEEIKEMSALNHNESSAYFKRFVSKIKIISGSDFQLSIVEAWPVVDFSGDFATVVPNLSISKIIYPFHSFL